MKIKAVTRYYNETFLSEVRRLGFESLCQFSKTIDLSYTTICRYGSLAEYPRGEKAIRIVEKVFNLPVDYLFSEECRLIVDSKVGRKREQIETISLSQISDMNAGIFAIEDKTVFEEDFRETMRILVEGKCLTDREKHIIKGRFGFDGEEKTLEQIGNEIGVTKEVIRQQEARALKKLSHPVNSKIIRDYVGKGGGICIS